MKLLVILLCAFISVCIANAQIPHFSVRMETIIFPVPRYSNIKGPDIVVEKALIGRFYSGDYYPIIDADQGGGVISTPFRLLADALSLMKKEKFEDIPLLYSPETRDAMASLLSDEDTGPRLIGIMKTLRRFIVQGMWLESPNRLIMYLRMNDSSGLVTPYMFEFIDGRWYISAGTLNSSLSNDLDAFYTKFGNDDMTILFPPSPSDIALLMKESKLIQFATEIGADISIVNKN